MAFNKSKDLNVIQKLIQRGQIDKAIKKLEGIIDVDPNDASLYIKIGDLYHRKTRTTEAKEAYFKAASIYLKDGYNNRAIATYKMASRTDPNDLEVNKRIAELFEKQGLIGDALQQYKYAATMYDQQNNHDDMYTMLEKIIELDPDNTPAKLKLAEVKLIKGENDNAYAILSEVSKTLKRNKLYSDYVKAFELLLAKAPKDKFLLREVANAHILAGNPAKGLKKIEEANKLDPEDTGTLTVLAETYILLDKDNKAESIYCDILRKDENSYRAKFGLSKIFLKKDNIDEALKTIEPFYSDFEEHGELNELSAFYESILEKAPNDINVLEKLGGIYRYQNNSKNMVRVYEQLAKVYADDDNTEKATFLYQKIFQCDPSHEAAKEYLSKSSAGAGIGVAGGGFEALDEETINEHITEANVYLKYGLYDQAKEHIDSVLKGDPNNVEAHVAQKDVYIGQTQNDLAISELLLLADIDQDNSETYLNEVLKLDPENSGAKARLSGEVPPPPPKEAVEDASSKQVESFEGIDLIIEEPEELKGKKGAKKKAAPKKSLEKELEEAEFYFAEGLFDDAKAIYNRVLLNDPYNMTAVEKLEQIERQTSAAGEEAEEKAIPDGDQLFDFAKELEDSLPDDLLKPLEGSSGGSMEDRHETDDIFSKFKKGIDEHIDSADYDSHYNLGIAYKEMGLLTDSTDEFLKALTADPAKVLECCAMLGMVSMETTKYQDAIKYFEKIFADVDLPEDQVQDLRYELAIAYKENGQYDKALKNFNIIHEIEPDFRDVEENIRLVINSKKGTKEEKTTSKKAKISYV